MQKRRITIINFRFRVFQPLSRDDCSRFLTSKQLLKFEDTFPLSLAFMAAHTFSIVCGDAIFTLHFMHASWSTYESLPVPNNLLTNFVGRSYSISEWLSLNLWILKYYPYIQFNRIFTVYWIFTNWLCMLSWKSAQKKGLLVKITTKVE